MKIATGACCTLFLLTSSVAFSQTSTGGSPHKTGTAEGTTLVEGMNSSEPTIDEGNLKEMENELAQADAARNSAPFNRYLDDDIIALGPGYNFHGKAEVLKDLQGSPCTITNPALTSFGYKWISSDLGLVSYKLNSTVTCNGKAIQSAEHTNSLWQKRNGKWVVIFHQSTADLPSTPNGGD